MLATAKEQQGNARTREGPATDRYAEAWNSPAGTGFESNGGGTAALRNERRRQSEVRLSYGEAKPRLATAMD